MDDESLDSLGWRALVPPLFWVPRHTSCPRRCLPLHRIPFRLPVIKMFQTFSSDNVSKEDSLPIFLRESTFWDHYRLSTKHFGESHKNMIKFVFQTYFPKQLHVFGPYNFLTTFSSILNILQRF